MQNNTNLFYRRLACNFNRQVLLIALIIPLFAFFPNHIEAEEIGQDTIVVAIGSFSPLVILNGDQISGFDIDIWEAIAEDLNLNYKYRVMDFPEMLDSLASGVVDVALAGITINAEREKKIDFSQHYLDSGLGIMVKSDATIGIFSRLRVLLTPGIIQGIVFMGLFIVLCGHVLYWSERGKDAINDHYFPGILEAFWCVIATITTVGYGDIAPRKWIGRLAAFMVMVTGIGLFGWLIGEFTAATTTMRMESVIHGPGDLRGKRVATIEGTTSVDAVNETSAIAFECKNPADAYKRLMRDEVLAVVFDSPNLMYYADNEGLGKVKVLSELIRKEYYGIAFSQGSQLREIVNRSLLKLYDNHPGNSNYNRIYGKWFGEK
jgi:polar amino acid transport system substrate-binding protein